MENKSLAVQSESFDIDLIKRTVAVGATDTELAVFLHQAKKSGLDPLARQIYFMKRKSKSGDVMTVMTSIDGARLISQRSGDFAGEDEPVFIMKQDGKTPDKCTFTVYKLDRLGNRNPITAVAYWDEYVPSVGQDFMWKKMPRTMLAKVAEALALRKAFPQDLSGIYTDEEMAQAGVEVKKNQDIEKMSENALKHISEEIESGHYDSVQILQRLEKAEKKLQSYPHLLEQISEIRETLAIDITPSESVSDEDVDSFIKADE